MIERKIPRDISKYETKLMLGLTTRQVVIGGPGIALAVGVFFAFKGTLGSSAMLPAMLCALPFLLFAAFKPLGMPLEVFMKTAMLPLLLAPANRRYKTENTYQRVLQSEQKAQASANKSKNSNSKKKFVSKNPDHRAV